MNRTPYLLSLHLRRLGLAALLTATLDTAAQAILREGHTDVGVDYDSAGNSWNLHVHFEDTDTEYSPPTDAVLLVGNTGHHTVPSGAEWGFLGSTGSDVWILPKTQDPSLLFLGIGSEEIPGGTFANDEFTLSLKAMTGPGQLAVFDTDTFGSPVVWMNSGDGIGAGDSKVLPSGTHSHINWAFSAAGDYTVWLEASAVRAGDSLFTSSGDVAYAFRVEAVPEPGVVALLALGAIGWLGLARTRQGARDLGEANRRGSSTHGEAERP